jgi:Transglycosylase SLT domain
MYDDIIKQASLSYLIDENWIKAIIKQESNWDQYALRYEPEYKYLYHENIYAANSHVTQITEIACQQMSWGFGQVMGATARQQGHQGPMGELFLPEINIKHICILLHNLKKRSPNVDDIFAMYNGGPEALYLVNYKYKNQSYVDSVKKYLQMYQNGETI